MDQVTFSSSEENDAGSIPAQYIVYPSRPDTPIEPDHLPQSSSNSSEEDEDPKSEGDGSTRSTASSFGSSLARTLTGSTSSSKTQALEPGTLGLENMGNTGYMNSALQCLAHEPELAEYFLNGVFMEELNPDNPLGMHGAIAQAFGALLTRLWAPSGSSTSYAPREFKAQLERFAPQYRGYQQHDSQELVALLLDGLHEDLNRVIKRRYVKNPGWEGGSDVELMQLAKKSWDGNMLKNDSVIVDLFQGQYQTTLVCRGCEKVDITFDPFMCLTLPLPKKWKHSIYYVPWDVNKPHVKVPVEIGWEASFKDLRQLLGRWMGAPPDNLLTLEVFSQKFHKNLDDSLLCGEIAQNDHIVCYELPCHAQQSRTYKPQPGDSLILPVYITDYRPSAPTARPLYGSYTSYQSVTPLGHPVIVVLSPEQAQDPAAIYAQVVGRLERWTNNARELFSWEVPSSARAKAGAVVEEIRINGVPPVDSRVEMKLEANKDGEEHTLEVTERKGEITEEEAQIVGEEDEDVLIEAVCMGPKSDLFQLKVQPNLKDHGIENALASADRAETLDARAEEVKAGTQTSLLREGDLLLCEFDKNLKAFHFGDVGAYRSNDDVRLAQWESFAHPEYEESQREAELKKDRGIPLQDCLDEFTKEQQPGKDDLRFCARCKKHQQATRKFDLWKAPDVLIVHLRRASDREKIDAFVDFPVEGLDLEEMVGERAAAKRLIEAGVPLEEFQLGNLDEPLVYDLFGVDEHIGGLCGVYYHAYALNHANQKWYHFNDSYVTPAKAQDAVNPNAYVLFYRRRSAEPLGGKTQAKLDAARLKR
ncbi:Ubiquitin carboxyl-terminal hydrolase 4 [Mycena sanguinolenta]|uniref:ubiquitinyl hydrolase 1 n=1 Tax=Mycena sanguinolenta TaxID=230812 RepID=A0A8H7CWE3_9AGAR|nr:Ubiquitin carboxyl-terminal hydrolase 4 [Mycena sanguinolenta]